jgi:hypothetical protein
VLVHWSVGAFSFLYHSSILLLESQRVVLTSVKGHFTIVAHLYYKRRLFSINRGILVVVSVESIRVLPLIV